MHPVGVAIAVLRNRKAHTLLLAALAGLSIGIVVVTIAVVSSLQAVLAGECPTTAAETSGPGTSSYESQEPSKEAIADIPSNYLEVYRAAAEEYGLDWAFLAAVGKQETDHGGGKEYNCINSSVGAQGPMQFMPETWASEGVDGNGDGKKDPCDYEDAIFSAASYFLNLGAPEDYHGALCSYYGVCSDANADYANEVLAQAEEYRAAGEEASSNVRPASAKEEVPASSDRSSAASPRAPPEALSGGSAAASPVASAAAASPAAAPEQDGGGGSGVPPNGWDTVDEDREIDYVLDTAYGSYFEDAAAEWNDLGGVEIHPSKSESDTDLVVTDGYVGGAMAKTFSEGRMTFDPAHMDGATDNAKLAAAGHELGHALGFPHNEAESVLNTPIITNGEDNVTAPTAYDEEQYSPVWASGDGDSSGGGGGESIERGAVFPLPEQYMDFYSDDWGADRPDGRSHEGTDLMVDEGTPIYSVTDGVVQETDGSSSSHYSEVGGYNIMVKATTSVGPIEEGDLLYYAHMKAPGPSVEPGQQVSAGDQIGVVGNTGYGPEVTEDEFEPHLHFGWYDPSGQRAETRAGAMNPYTLLQWLKDHGGTVSGSDDLAPSPAGSDAPAYCASPLARLFGFFTGGGEDGSSDTGTPPSDGSGGGGTTASGDGQAAVEEAKKYLDVPYVLAGPEGCIPGEQMDCTCLTTTVFKEFGLNLPDAPEEVTNYGEPVEGEPQAGDIHVWGDPGDATGGHVAIDMGDGNIIHANMVTMSTSIGPMYDSPEYLGAWRMVE